MFHPTRWGLPSTVRKWNVARFFYDQELQKNTFLFSNTPENEQTNNLDNLSVQLPPPFKLGNKSSTKEDKFQAIG